MNVGNRSIATGIALSMVIDNPTLRIVVGVLIMLGAVGTALLIFTVLAPVLMQYRLDGRGVSVRLFGLVPIVRVKYENIVDARVVSASEGMKLVWCHVFSTLRLGNRFTRRGVFITCKAGLTFRVGITPADPDQFVAELMDRKAAAIGA